MMIGTFPPIGPIAYNWISVTIPAINIAFCKKAQSERLQILFRRQFHRPCNDKNWCKVTYEHCKYMLQTKENRFLQRKFPVKVVFRTFVFLLIHFSFVSFFLMHDEQFYTAIFTTYYYNDLNENV